MYVVPVQAQRDQFYNNDNKTTLLFALEDYFMPRGCLYLFASMFTPVLARQQMLSVMSSNFWPDPVVQPILICTVGSLHVSTHRVRSVGVFFSIIDLVLLNHLPYSN